MSRTIRDKFESFLETRNLKSDPDYPNGNIPEDDEG